MDKKKIRFFCVSKEISRATFVVGVVTVLFAVSNCLSFLSPIGYFAFIGGAVSIVVAAILIHGVHDEKPIFFIPYLIWNVLQILMHIGFVVILFMIWFDVANLPEALKSKNNEGDFGQFFSKTSTVAIIGLYMIEVVVSIHFEYVVYVCFWHLHYREKAGLRPNRTSRYLKFI